MACRALFAGILIGFAPVVALAAGGELLLPPCPTTLDGWVNWRALLLLDLNRPDDLGDGRGALLEHCSTEPDQQRFFTNPRFQACMGPLREMAAGMTYYRRPARVSAIGTPPPEMPPDLFTVPAPLQDPAFLDVFNAPYDRVDSEAFETALITALTQIPGARAMVAPSTIRAGDAAYVIHIPGEFGDRWIHIVRHQHDPTREMRLLTIWRRNPDGTVIDPPREFFDMFLVRADGAVIEGSSTADGGASQHATAHSLRSMGEWGMAQAGTCIQCHKTGAITLVSTGAGVHSIYPNRGSTRPEDFTWMRRSVDATATALPWGMNRAMFGPGLGEINPPARDDRFMNECAGPPLPTASRDRVRASMNCRACHNGDRVGTLTFPLTKDGTETDLLRLSVGAGRMPPGNDLNEGERQALMRCLRSEYFGGFNDARLGGSPRILGTIISGLLLSCGDDGPVLSAIEGDPVAGSRGAPPPIVGAGAAASAATLVGDSAEDAAEP